jgi:hypothetical protein
MRILSLVLLVATNDLGRTRHFAAQCKLRAALRTGVDRTYEILI